MDWPKRRRTAWRWVTNLSTIYTVASFGIAIGVGAVLIGLLQVFVSIDWGWYVVVLGVALIGAGYFAARRAAALMPPVMEEPQPSPPPSLPAKQESEPVQAARPEGHAVRATNQGMVGPRITAPTRSEKSLCAQLWTEVRNGEELRQWLPNSMSINLAILPVNNTTPEHVDEWEGSVRRLLDTYPEYIATFMHNPLQRVGPIQQYPMTLAFEDLPEIKELRKRLDRRIAALKEVAESLCPKPKA